MIKFFRHIRQTLIMENKTSKYLKYAIGEIVLVVIGILIALQINNWNETRKDNKKEIYLLTQLQKEFKADSILLNRYINITNTKVVQGKEVKRTIENKEYNISLDSIVPNVFYNGRLVIFEAYIPTFDEIISSGNLGILKNDVLKNMIKTYKNNNESLKTFLYSESQKIKADYNSHLYKYFDSEIMTLLWQTNPNDRYKIHDSLLKYNLNVKGFIDDPESLYHVKTAIGVDRELAWIYAERKMPAIKLILNELKAEINKTNDQIF